MSSERDDRERDRPLREDHGSVPATPDDAGPGTAAGERTADDERRHREREERYGRPAGSS